MAAKLVIGGFTVYSSTPPPIARLVIGGFSVSPTSTAVAAPAKLVIGGFSVLQARPARLEHVFWKPDSNPGQLREVQEWVCWNGELLPAPTVG